LRRSIQRELNDFFGRINDSGYSIQHVTKSAFTQARSKLKPEAFSELSSSVVNSFYGGAPYLLWGKHRILACDGSTIMLPASKDIATVFKPEGFGPGASAERSVAKISLVYDVLNLLALNAKIDTFKVHEATLLKTQLAEVAFMPDDILLLDRGYPGIGLLYELQQRGIGFCVRLKDNWWNEVNAMLEAKETSKAVTFRLPKKDRGLQEAFNGETDTVTVRLAVIELKDGKKEILCTSLTQAKKYTLDSLKQLYHFRWGIEEAYKLFKARADLASFSGMSAISVKQDFYAAIFSMNICAAMSFPIEQKVREESREANLKYTKKVNKTNALSMVCECMIGVFIKKRIKRFLHILDEILTRTTEAIRPHRSFPRNHKQKKPRSMNYKKM
jgi:hypothetical protein